MDLKAGRASQRALSMRVPTLPVAYVSQFTVTKGHWIKILTPIIATDENGCAIMPELVTRFYEDDGCSLHLKQYVVAEIKRPIAAR